MQVEISPNFHIEYARAGEGAPIVFLHAFPLNHQMWRGQMDALQNEYSCLAPNARGCGSTSGFESTPSIEQMARDLNAFLDALQIQEKIILCGLSMGGYTALNFAREYSHRLRALVLCDTRAEADSAEAKEKRDANIELVNRSGAAALTAQVLPALLGETTQRGNLSLVEQVRKWGEAQSASTLVNALEALRDRPDATSWLAQIQVPTLLVFGGEDALIPRAAIETLKSGIQNSNLEVIPRTGHLSNLENLKAFNAVLFGFVRNLSLEKSHAIHKNFTDALPNLKG